MTATLRMLSGRLVPPSIVLAFAFAGWAICAAIMGILPPLVGLDAALGIHLAGGPLVFAALAYAYHRRFHRYSPLGIATAFVLFVVALDAFVVALLVLRSFDMFRSVIGTWLPFALIFLASWGTGRWARRGRASG